MMSGKLVTYIWVSELWKISDRPVFVKGGPAHGICYIILCDIFFHLMIMRVPSLKINICACFTEDMQGLWFPQWCC